MVSVVFSGPPSVRLNGSSKTLSASIVLSSRETIIAGANNGSVIYQNDLKSPAPSIFALSYKSFGTIAKYAVTNVGAPSYTSGNHI